MKDTYFLYRTALMIILCTIISPCVCSQNTTCNYIISETMLDPTGSHSIKSVQYYDGLGRPNVLASGGVNPDEHYVYSLTEYDMLGRISRSWLPSAGTNSPDYIDIQTMSGYSRNSYEGDNYAYKEMAYDAFNRPIVNSTPGNMWHQNHKVKTTEYITNGDNVRRYRIDSEGYPIDTQVEYYPAFTLKGERQIDEDSHVLEIYKDILDNVVLERRKEAEGQNNDTYYIYDRGQLRTVIPPLYQDPNRRSNTLLYRYQYDSYGRCSKKNLPDCDSIIYVYDKNGRMAFMQDGRMRTRNVYRFYLYDQLGRLAIQGICSSIPRNINNLPANVSYGIGNVDVCNTGYRTMTGYSPQNAVLEIVNYYDNYGFISNSYIQTLIGYADFSKPEHCNAVSFLTGQIVNTSNGQPLCSVYYYDEKGNVIDKRETILGGGNLKTMTHYTFTNKPDTITETLTKNGGVRTVKLTNTYDPNTDKLATQKHNYSNTSDVTIASYGYDELGRVGSVSRHGRNIVSTYEYNINGWTTNIHSERSSTHTLLFDEQIHYIDGPGTPCYNGNISSTKYTTYDHPMGANTFYAYKYRYDRLDRLTKASYGIGSTSASSSYYMDLSIYDEEVTYDANSNIKSLVRHGQYGNGIIDNLIYSYTGNRVDRIQDSAPSVLSERFYDFKDNKMVVPDAKEYGYDGCGSTTYDLNKGITHIDYDYSGNPTRIQFADYNVTEYVYSADGRRLKSIHRTAVPQSGQLGIGATHTLTASEVFSVDSTEYINDFEFKNGTLSMCKFDGGYLAAPFNQSSYKYYITDHLGNKSLVVDRGGNVHQTTHYYPFGSIHHSSTNQGYQKYKYNGKEFDEMHGLNEYDYGARQSDPAIGRFTSMDPLCEKYYNVSPYAYCLGNPVKNIDPDGRVVETAWDAANVIMDVASCATNIAAGNYLSAGIDALGLLFDAGATVIPGVPAGVGWALKSYRTSKDVKMTANILKENAAAGKAFENAIVRIAKKGDKNVGSQITLIPLNGKGYVKDNITRVDGLMKNKDGTWTIIESKASKNPRLSKGQNASREHVIENNQFFEVRSAENNLDLKKTQKIQVTYYITVYKR